MVAVVDLFCGAGGLSHGFRLEGFDVLAGVDTDETCRYAFEANNGAPFLRYDVAEMTAKDIRDLFGSSSPTVLVGCAPCQPFSSYSQKNENPKWSLVETFGRLIAKVHPDIVSMENVPRLLKFRGGDVFGRFVAMLRESGYRVHWTEVFSPGYGVPQRRTRLVLLASRLGAIKLEAPSYHPPYRTVRSAIGALQPLMAGEIDPFDPYHRASTLSETNLRRIEASIPGGTWHDWDDDLVAKCHKSHKGWGYVSVYSRMSWDEPAPTITTQFYGFGNGRFGHPEQNRAISLREGAILQSFPEAYKFVEPADPIQFKVLGRMIGNAVPVLIARAIARSVRNHLDEVNAW